MCTADLGFTGGKNDIGAGIDTDFIGACTPALMYDVKSLICYCVMPHGLVMVTGVLGEYIGLSLEDSSHNIDRPGNTKPVFYGMSKKASRGFRRLFW